MNNINNIFNKKEIENKLKDFKEGQDYSISPTDEPNIKTYNFHNDKLRSVFRGDRVPVRITQEAYDGKDYTYRGHFEEGKDYRYSAQRWDYSKGYKGDRGIEDMPDWMQSVFAGREEGIGSRSWEVYGESGNIHTGQKHWEGRWIYEGKGNRNQEPKRIEPNHDLKWKHDQLKDKLNSLLARPESDFGVNGKEKKEYEVAEVRKDIATIEREIEKEKNNSNSRPLETCQCGRKFDKAKESWAAWEMGGRNHWCSYDCAEKFKENPHGKVEYLTPVWYNDSIQQKGRMGRGKKGSWADNSNLEKENQELRQQLAEVQKQLTEVLEELKKLKSNINGKGSERLEQQIVQNERLIKEGKNVSVSEVQEQVNKSQALMNELNTTVSPTKDNKANSSLPYVIGGSVILVSTGIIGYLLVKKNRGKKVA